MGTPQQLGCECERLRGVQICVRVRESGSGVAVFESVCTGLVQMTLVMNFALVSVSAEEYAGEVNVCV